jgi:hypothetical protein
MRSQKPRRLHLDVDPPVVVQIGDRNVTFDGVTLLRPHVMIEYDVYPPIDAESPFGPHLLIVDVTDDTSNELYPTMWHDWRWRDRGPGRTTTRLERRPPPDATRMHIVVRPAEPPRPDGHRDELSTRPAVVAFHVELPADHHLPWPK